MSQITLKDVTKRYADGTEAVKQMNVEIADGEFMILVGPSGCGKSTALRMVAGLEEISDGDLIIDGQVVNDMTPKERDIAMVFQSYALYPHMTVRDNMGFALKLSGVDKAEIDRRVTDAARILDLEQHLDRKPANLSGGQRQRVAMGRAIVREPKAYLMDEPLSNLDAKLRVQMRAEVSDLQQRTNTTTLYVTHDQTEAMTLGDRVAVMRAGVVQQVDTPRNLYDEPQNLFVAGFIGSPSMNFFPAALDGGRLRLPFGEVELPDLQRRRMEGAGTDGQTGDLIAGIRPEDFEDSAVIPRDKADRGLAFDTKIDLLESMGSEYYAYFDYQGEQAQADALEEIAEDAGMVDLPGGASTRAVARLDPTSRVSRGEQARLWLDTSKVHLFDGKSGRNLTCAPA